MATPNDVWPNRNVAATVVDTDPPPPSGWSSWNPEDMRDRAWPGMKKPQQHPPRKVVKSSERLAQTAPAPRRVGRWIVAGALWAFAGGLVVGPAVASFCDRGVAVGVGWLQVHGPGFLKPYLPKPLPKPSEPPASKRLQLAAPLGTEFAPPTKPASPAAPKTERGRKHK